MTDPEPIPAWYQGCHRFPDGRQLELAYVEDPGHPGRSFASLRVENHCGFPLARGEAVLLVANPGLATDPAAAPYLICLTLGRPEPEPDPAPTVVDEAFIRKLARSLGLLGPEPEPAPTSWRDRPQLL